MSTPSTPPSSVSTFPYPFLLCALSPLSSPSPLSLPNVNSHPTQNQVHHSIPLHMSPGKKMKKTKRGREEKKKILLSYFTLPLPGAPASEPRENAALYIITLSNLYREVFPTCPYYLEFIFSIFNCMHPSFSLHY